MSTASIDIRSFEEGDEPAVVELWNLVFPDDPPWNEPTAVIRRKLTVQPELFLVASSDDRIVGMVMAGFDGCRGWVHHLAVSPNSRRKGVGRRLLREASSRLRAMGCPKLNLQVRVGNEDAVRFYQSLGLRVEERISMAVLLEPESDRSAPR